MAHPMTSLSQSRLTIWKPAARMAVQHPLTGVGLDCFKIAFTKYSEYDFNALDGTFVSSRTAHNEWLQAAATCGLPGLAALLLTVVLFLRLAVRRIRTAPVDHKALWAAVLASGCAYLFQNLFSFGVAALLLLWNIHLASINRDAPFKSNEPPGPSPRLLFPALALCALLAVPVVTRLTADLSFARGMAYLEYVQKPERSLSPSEIDLLTSKSLEFLRQASDRFPLEVKYHLYTGMALEQLAASHPESLRQALRVYDQTVEWVPSNAYFHNNRGRVLLRISRNEGQPPVEAESALRSSARFAPENPFFLSQWGSALKTLGRDQEADAPLSHAFSLNRDVASKTMAQMAMDEHQAGLKQNAYALLEEALARHPGSAECWFLRGYLGRKDGKKLQSEMDFDEATRLNPEMARLRESINENK